MSQPVLIKVYAAFTPCSEDLRAELESACASAMGEGEEPVVGMLGDMVRISFEGLYFPVDDVAAVVERLGAAGAAGKMDVLDLENWRLTRWSAADGRVECRSNTLNSVLDYSGF